MNGTAMFSQNSVVHDSALLDEHCKIDLSPQQSRQENESVTRLDSSNHTDSSISSPKPSISDSKPKPTRPVSGIPRLSCIPRASIAQTNVSKSNGSGGQYNLPHSSSFDKSSRTVPSGGICQDAGFENPCGEQGSRSRHVVRRTYKLDRAKSECPQRQDTDTSDTSSVFSSSGKPKLITSKIGSLKQANYVPGGGNVKIFNQKVELGPIKGKCGTLANLNHKPGGGNVQIVEQKLDFVKKIQSKVGSLDNKDHVAGGGKIQVFDEKINFDKTAKSKVGSLKNASHRPTGGSVQIFNEHLPWLKYNKPNLAPEERNRINKRSGHTVMTTSTTSQ